MEIPGFRFSRNAAWRQALPLALAMAVSLAQATPYRYPYNTMTGAQVVSKLTTRPATDAQYGERDMAYYYVAGIKDGTQGSSWCFSGTLKPDELTSEIVLALKARHSEATLQGNAAPLIVEELRLKYPCARAKGGKP